MNTLRSTMHDGLWKNNPGIVQLLGLCPLLAITTSVVNALGLAIATLFVLCSSNLIVSVCRRALQRDIRIPIYVLLIAALVTASELFFHAYLPTLHARLGIFLPLIVTNCTIVARAESFASRQPPRAALLDGLAYGLGFAAVLLVVGALRELLGTGQIFNGMHLLIPGAPETGLVIANEGLLLAILPPGAFFALALVLVFKNWIDLR